MYALTSSPPTARPSTPAARIAPEEMPPPPIHHFEESTFEQVKNKIEELEKEIEEIDSQTVFTKKLKENFLKVLKEKQKNEKVNSVIEIEQLVEEYQTALESYHQSDLAPLQEDFNQLNKYLDNSIRIYKYLTYGTGRFEEYDGYSKNDLIKLATDIPSSNSSSALLTLHKQIGQLINLYGKPNYKKKEALCKSIRQNASRLNYDEDYMALGSIDEILNDQESSIYMSKLLDLKAIGEVLEEDIIKKFHDLLNNYKQILSQFSKVIIDPRNEELIDFLEDLKTCLTKISQFIDSTIEDLYEEVAAEEPERCDDPFDEGKIFALNQGAETLTAIGIYANTSLKQLKSFSEKLQKCSREIEEEENRATELEKKGGILLKTIKKLKNKKTGVSDIPSQLANQSFNDFLIQIERIINKHTLVKEYPVDEYALLKEDLKDFWTNLEEKIQQGKEIEDLIGLYIEIKRAEKKRKTFWTCRLNIAQKIIDQIGVIATENLKEAAFSSALDNRFFYQTEPLHPLDSPLVHVIHELSKYKIGDWGNFLFLAKREVNSFERGMIKVILKGKNIDRVISDHDAFSTALKYKPHQQTKEKPSVAKSYPEYYDTFDVKAIEAYEENSPLSNEMIKFYSLLTVHLAYIFSDKTTRNRKKLPAGNPIAAILVSKTGQILSWAVNTISEDKNKDPIRHAEINTLMSYYKFTGKGKIPEGASLFSSLKSCHMCAGGIYETMNKKTTENPINVYYAQNDPGQNNTVIEETQEKVNLEIFINMDKSYSKLKEKNNKLNAAVSLDFMPEFAKEIKEKLLSFEGLPASFYSYIQKFLKYATDDTLEFKKVAQVMTSDPTVELSGNIEVPPTDKIQSGSADTSEPDARPADCIDEATIKDFFRRLFKK